MDRVLKELLPLAQKWNEIGTALKLSGIFLKELQGQDKPPEDRLREVVVNWLGGNSACPSWEVLAEALRAAAVGEEEVADQLDQKYAGMGISVCASGWCIWCALFRNYLF